MEINKKFIGKRVRSQYPDINQLKKKRKIKKNKVLQFSNEFNKIFKKQI